MVGAPRHAHARARLRWARLARGSALICALAAGLYLGCLPELPHETSCGDGWWDREAEPCDPSSPDQRWIDACRNQGWDVDATCTASCELRASEEDCQVCGDGVASGTEPCDGNDLRGTLCPETGSNRVRCSDSCTLDYELCPPVCGDGFVTGIEECDPSLSCGDDDDCGEGRRCYPLYGECVPSEGFGPNLSCSYYDTKAIGIHKPYSSGVIDRCTDKCFFGRNSCGFCGDGELDDGYEDLTYPDGAKSDLPGEYCDIDVARRADIIEYCELCVVGEPVNSDVTVLCNFTCNADCTGFAPPEDVSPGSNPEAHGCCLEKGSPCPNFGNEGVPEFPCCSWYDNPEWMAEQKCVIKDTEDLPIVFVCP